MSVDFVTRSGILFLPIGQCPDMGRAIALFTKVCPKIQLIETMAGLTEDTKYILRDGKWSAWDSVRRSI